VSATATVNVGAGNKNGLALQEKLDRLMAKTKPNKRELTLQCFRELYPKLEEYLAQGKLLKDVLAAFNELAQAKVCTRTFSDMLKEERVRRNDNGNPVCCPACNQPLPPNALTNSGTNSETSTDSDSEE
jgi:hypothetical protein